VQRNPIECVCVIECDQVQQQSSSVTKVGGNRSELDKKMVTL